MDNIIETNKSEGENKDYPFFLYSQCQKILKTWVSEWVCMYEKEGIIDFFMLCNKNNVVQP